MPSGGASSFVPGPSRGGAGAPERAGHAGFCICGAREDEQEIGEPVEIDGRKRVHPRYGQDSALGSAADGPRQEEPRRTLAPAGEDEALELGQRRVGLVDLLLEPVDRLVGDPQPLVALDEWNGQVGAEIEELVLDALQAARPAHERVELVDVADRGPPRVELRDARAVAEARLALVPAARVDARQADGLVALAHAP